MAKVGGGSYAGSASTSLGAWIFNTTTFMPYKLASRAAATPANGYSFDNGAAWVDLDTDYCTGFTVGYADVENVQCKLHTGAFPTAQSKAGGPTSTE